MQRQSGGRFHWRVGEVQLQSFTFTWRDRETPIQIHTTHLGNYGNLRLYTREMSLSMCTMRGTKKPTPPNVHRTLGAARYLNLATSSVENGEAKT